MSNGDEPTDEFISFQKADAKELIQKLKSIYHKKKKEAQKRLSLKKDKWIQKSVKHKGALRKHIRQRYGQRAFTDRDTIKVEYLKKIANDKNETEHRRKQARLALNLRKYRK